MAESEKAPVAGANFIHNIIDEDIKKGKNGGRVHTRFPPEPNGYLHIGHAKSICLNFGIKEKYQGKCNLRFDDTNPVTEDPEFIRAIEEDIQWLGFAWDNLCHASHYFDQLYAYAVQLIKEGHAYVDSLTGDEVREYRGSHTIPGKNSPYRDRSAEENLDLFERMKAGEFKDGEHVLRAKIDMTSGNMNLRDPLIYRIRHAHHPVTGDKWCIYPLYDFTHGLSDAIEGITHSICTLEFEDHRPLYDWFLEVLKIKNPPQQIEFSKLLLNFVVLSKRNLKRMVDEKIVNGWDDPRMPTIRGFRRRGYTPASIRNFCSQIGVSKAYSVIDYSLLEESLRQDLNDNAARRMAVLRPLKVTITNYDKEEVLKAPSHPSRPEMGERDLPMTNTLWIEQDDFMEEAPKKYFRLKPGGEVRLRNSYVIKCNEVIKNENGDVIELKCTADLQTLGKNPEGRKVKGIIHWVSAKTAIPMTVRLYDRLFTDENPSAHDDKDFTDFLNPNSLEVLQACYGEPSLKDAKVGESFQFERLGYFCMDPDTHDNQPLFNRSVTLRDTWK
ncbi:MAG: glutamine--tRNA ligase/YqeY domain fusion protein [Bdellovibrionales bacterium]|nr:glutamine--tRNA ligase/YqeY domain fusion protein [Bdellovibrionales bacterium]